MPSRRGLETSYASGLEEHDVSASLVFPDMTQRHRHCTGGGGFKLLEEDKQLWAADTPYSSDASEGTEYRGACGKRDSSSTRLSAPFGSSERSSVAAIGVLDVKPDESENEVHFRANDRRPAEPVTILHPMHIYRGIRGARNSRFSDGCVTFLRAFTSQRRRCRPVAGRRARQS